MTCRVLTVSHRRKRRGWKPAPAPHEDLVKGRFTADRPDRLWFCDITQHRAKDGWLYCVPVIDALETARWQRRPKPGTIVHADRGALYTSWIFGHRLRQTGLLGVGPANVRGRRIA